MSMITNESARRERPATEPKDEGTILVMVLVMMVIGSLIVLPLLVYTMSVFRAGTVQTNKSEAVEAARGGTWVALSNEGALYNMCTGGALPSSLPNVTTTCSVLDTATLRPPAEVPYHVATVQSDILVPAPLDNGSHYVNPNNSTLPGDFDLWLDSPDWSIMPQAGKVWLPQLPVQATSAGGTRDTQMAPGTWDPAYASCRVFFPGTFTTQIVIDEPAYFASGVYYFTEPIVLENGANVVVGNGSAGACTTDFEAIAAALTVPDPLNMSGLGGTFVLGDNARIVIDDSGSGDIRFAMNQRYVSEDETSVLSSSSVSIVSVNGTHEPLVGAEVLGDDLIVNDVIHVPASTVGTAGDPLAALSDYTPSNLTTKAYAPEAPTNVVADDYQRNAAGQDGRLVVSWDAPNNNGSPITGYTVSDSQFGHSCSPPAPTLPDTSLQTSCIITGISHQGPSGPFAELTVTATNALGTSLPSANLTAPRVDLTLSIQSPVIDPPDKPVNVVVSTVYSDGLEISWDPPADDGGGPIRGYRVDAKLGAGPGGPVVDTCDAWWDETSCVLLGLLDSTVYHIDVIALQTEGPPYTEYESTHGHLGVGADLLVLLSGSPAPGQLPAVTAIRVPDAILEFTTTGSDTTSVSIIGYVAVPQGRVELGAADPSSTSISMLGGFVAGDIWVDPGGVPSNLDVEFDNPIAQKIVLLNSTVAGPYNAMSQAVVQVNKSGSIAINSWLVQ